MVSVVCGVVLLQLLQLLEEFKLPEVVFEVQLNAKVAGVRMDRHALKVRNTEKSNLILCIMF